MAATDAAAAGAATMVIKQLAFTDDPVSEKFIALGVNNWNKLGCLKGDRVLISGFSFFLLSERT